MISNYERWFNRIAVISLLLMPVSMVAANFSFYLMVMVSGGYWLYILFAKRGHELEVSEPFKSINHNPVYLLRFIPKNGLWLSVALFIISQWLATAISPFTQTPWQDIRETIHPLGFLLISSVFYHQSSLQENIKNKLWLIIIPMGIVSFYSVFQFFLGINWVSGLSSFLGSHRLVGNHYRVSGFFSHPLTMAYLYLILLPILFIATKKQFITHNSIKKGIILLTIILINVATMMTYSRTVMVLVIVQIFAILWILRPPHFRKISISIIISLLVGFSAIPSLKSRVEQMIPNAQQAIFFDRIDFWKVYWQVFKEHPVLGVGCEVSLYPENREKNYKKVGLGHMERKYPAHNNYLQIMADTGLVGLTTFLFIFLTYFWLVAKQTSYRGLNSKYSSSKHYQYLHVISTCALLLGVITQNAFKDSAVAISFWLLLAVFTPKGR